jgi:pantothenate kinase-related protein Tda10
VFFEGWMLGFRPVGVEAASEVEAALGEVDRQLAAYEAAWDSLVDSWLVIRMSDPQVRCLCVWCVDTESASSQSIHHPKL